MPPFIHRIHTPKEPLRHLICALRPPMRHFPLRLHILQPCRLEVLPNLLRRRPLRGRDQGRFELRVGSSTSFCLRDDVYDAAGGQ